ncbi:uncharacterized mitochondrial protein AtMg00810-like [Hibiscus syriacus]|uniref:uncharacterized mitochondrial protein AtMg00810-like n=1 Tax=Hibiscus syriacus TaxID=106335 RepID=UPI0019204CEF|nr:uncharacterized mitochondrial protein AtMg00810-like [Hibiscus syriacus]
MKTITSKKNQNQKKTPIEEAESSVDESNERPRRTRRDPTWMEDYVNGDYLSGEANKLNIVLTTPEDPINSEDAHRSGYWQWIQKSTPLRRTKLGTLLIFQLEPTPLKSNGSIKLNEGFQKYPNEQTFFTKGSDEDKILILSIYVDDLIYTGDDEDMIIDFKNSMMKVFDMSDLGKMRFFLCIEVLHEPNGIFLCQRKYTREVLKRFGKIESKPVNIPIVLRTKMNKDEDGVLVDGTYFKQLVRSLMFLTTTRSDIMFSASLISRYMARPTELHLQAGKRILRYLNGTSNYGILYKKGGKEEELLGFTVSDYAGDVEDRKSTSRYVFLLSSGVVSWSSKKQPIVTLSTIETEFVGAAACACQAIWMRRILMRRILKRLCTRGMYYHYV